MYVYFYGDFDDFCNNFVKISLYRITLYREDIDPDLVRILTETDPEGQNLQNLPRLSGHEYSFIASLLPRFLELLFLHFLLVSVSFYFITQA
jgi:hypothetical protein